MASSPEYGGTQLPDIASLAQDDSSQTVETEVDQCLAFNLLVDDVDKMERLSDQLADKGLRGGRSFLLRSLLHAPWDLDALARDVKKFEA
jgi:hypothetical protein